jgi:hypothetical protein
MPSENEPLTVEWILEKVLANYQEATLELRVYRQLADSELRKQVQEILSGPEYAQLQSKCTVLRNQVQQAVRQNDTNGLLKALAGLSVEANPKRYDLDLEHS